MKWGLDDTQLESPGGEGHTAHSPRPRAGGDHDCPPARRADIQVLPQPSGDTLRLPEGQTHRPLLRGTERPRSPLFGDRHKSEKTDPQKSSTQTEHTYTHTRTHLSFPQRQIRGSRGDEGPHSFLPSPLSSSPLFPRLLASSDLLNQQGKIQFVPVCTRPSSSPFKQYLISKD